MVTARVLQAYDCVAQNIPYGTDGDAIMDLEAGVLDFAYVTRALTSRSRTPSTSC